MIRAISARPRAWSRSPCSINVLAAEATTASGARKSCDTELNTALRMRSVSASSWAVRFSSVSSARSIAIATCCAIEMVRDDGRCEPSPRAGQRQNADTPAGRAEGEVGRPGVGGVAGSEPGHLEVSRGPFGSAQVLGLDGHYASGTEGAVESSDAAAKKDAATVLLASSICWAALVQSASSDSASASALTRA